jgi:hypothetical protein
MNDQNPDRWTAGAHHVGLAVPDLDAALRFFTKGLSACAGVRLEFIAPGGR